MELTDEYGEEFESTFLPEVAEEQKWNQLETLQELLEKAGYLDAEIEDVIDKVRVTTYESVM